jgi:hypothetical protein
MASWSAKSHHSSQRISGLFELTEPTRSAVSAWIEKANLKTEQYLFPSRLAKSPHISTRQYARIVHQWVAAIGLATTAYSTQAPRWISWGRFQAHNWMHATGHNQPFSVGLVSPGSFT